MLPSVEQKCPTGLQPQPPPNPLISSFNFFLFYILDAVDPFVLLLGCGGGDAVHHVVSFHYSPISLCLTCLDQLTAVVGDVQLKAVLGRRSEEHHVNDHNMNSAVKIICSNDASLCSETMWNLRAFWGPLPPGC